MYFIQSEAESGKKKMCHFTIFVPFTSVSPISDNLSSPSRSSSFAPSAPPPFIVVCGEISVLFTLKIKAELGRRQLFCDNGDKIWVDGGGGVCV